MEALIVVSLAIAGAGLCYVFSRWLYNRITYKQRQQAQLIGEQIAYQKDVRCHNENGKSITAKVIYLSRSQQYATVKCNETGNVLSRDFDQIKEVL